MRILLLHSYYRQRGGEEEVFASERELLLSRGHEVTTFTVDNEQMVRMGAIQQASVVLWNSTSYRDIRAKIRAERPDVAHFHNTFPLLSPAGYYAAKAEGVSIVQTLHNYRLLCSNALFYRDGRVCEDCLGKKVTWPGAVHACYRGSRRASAAVVGALSAHRLLGTWHRKVDRFIALCEFAREKFIRGGLPADRIVVKPNFVSDAGLPEVRLPSYGLYIGRLSAEKGLRTLIGAWRNLPDVPLKIVGSGPLQQEVEELMRCDGLGDRIELLGWRSQEEVRRLMMNASFLVVPSEWYEGAVPRVVLEAYACGLPVIGARIGCVAEGVHHERTGLLFTPGNASDLAEQVRRVHSDSALLPRLGAEARREYELKYSVSSNYTTLIQIYREAFDRGAVEGRMSTT